jgi:Ca2+-binding EF-hand superfamily protein
MSKNKEDEFIELLSEQEICELHEAFNIFDVESDGSINSEQLIILMNSLKQYPSQKELEKILNEFNLQLKKFKLKYDMK